MAFNDGISLWYDGKSPLNGGFIAIFKSSFRKWATKSHVWLLEGPGNWPMIFLVIEWHIDGDIFGRDLVRRFDVFFLGTIEAIVVMDVYVYIKAGDIKWGYNTYIYIYISC